jgi:hypothetical protein
VNRRESMRCLLLTVHVFICAEPSAAFAQIQDNSFLVEEAYNQERGVVQHIGTFERSRPGDWVFGFSQEWPLGGIRHQFSYRLAMANVEGLGTGLGDIEVNYRYQLVGNPEANTVVSPRFTVILPAGSSDEGLGAGAVGFGVGLPLTLVISDEFVSHWNASGTFVPSTRNLVGDEATTATLNLGGSLIWLLSPSFNLLAEALWSSRQSVVGDGRTVREELWRLNPGFRVAIDVSRDLQVVPGFAYTLGLGPASEEDGVFIYLSFEHPFKH